MNVRSIILMFVVLLILVPVNSFAGEYFNTNFGAALGSVHFTNDLKRSRDFNGKNLGLTVYFDDVKNVVPLVDSFSLSYIHTNSFYNNSVYGFADKNLWKRGHVSLDLGVGVATGYEKDLSLAHKLGFLPLAGLRLTIYNLEVGLLPTGIIEEKGVNVLTFGYRF